MARIILKDKDGNHTTYEDVLGVILKNADGGTTSFGSDGWTPETLKCTSGLFKPSSAVHTVSHNLGTVPDMVFVGRRDVPDAVNTNRGHLVWAIGFSRRLADDASVGIPNRLSFDDTDGDDNVNGNLSEFNAIDEEGTVRCIRNADSTSFIVGYEDDYGSKCELLTSATYIWIAISGIGVRMNKSEV